MGRPFHVDYDRALLLVADAWKHQAKGIPQGTFLLAYYENEEHVSECALLRVLKPARLPTDSDIISAMIEYYKDNLKTEVVTPFVVQDLGITDENVQPKVVGIVMWKIFSNGRMSFKTHWKL